MDLEVRIEEYTKKQKSAQVTVDYYKAHLEALSKLTQPTTDEFYVNLPTEKYYTAEFEEKKYEYILGGDGRSSAWSEWRDGIVLVVKVKEGYYLTNELITVLTNYVKEKYKGQYNHLERHFIDIKL
jgi:uncharacterized membrane-anchored protein